MDFLFAQSQPLQGGGILSFLPFILIMVILYFFMLRPQAKKQKEKETMINNLNKGDKVVTMGGIIGTVNGFKEKGRLIPLKIDNNTIITLNKSAVAGLSGKIDQNEIE